MPAYDKIFNELFAPLMEKQTDQLLRSDKFLKADLVSRREMLKTTLTDVQKTVKEGYVCYSRPARAKFIT
jgi:hypothetical protein